MAAVVPRLETAVLHAGDHSEVIELLLSIQDLIRKRRYSCFIGHIRAHSSLPGPLAEGNNKADEAIRQVLGVFEEAQASHRYFHQNSLALRKQFGLKREQARQIVRQCTTCGDINHVPLSEGVNPRGLQPGHMWQMDVTHYQPFGNLWYVHVIVDLFSGFLFAGLQTGEATKHVVAVCLAAFVVLGVPKILKTDNGPAYTSKGFQQFCLQYKITHLTGIPYNPQGQGIVERAHRTLKAQFEKTKKGE